jgi:hypothetical protein
MRMAAGIATAVLALAAAGEARGETSVHVSPFGGLQFGGSLIEKSGRDRASLNEGFVWGATVEVEIVESWRFAVLYSRQETRIESVSERPLFDLKVERYMAGIQEEKGEGPVRWIGTAFIGATRLAPRAPSLGSDLRFAAGLELGVKYFVSNRLGLRAQARGFYTFVDADADALCLNGTCVFAFSGSGMAQGEVSGGILLAF